MQGLCGYEPDVNLALPSTSLQVSAGELGPANMPVLCVCGRGINMDLLIPGRRHPCCELVAEMCSGEGDRRD
jgi:hypothetical protein